MEKYLDTSCALNMSFYNAGVWSIHIVATTVY